MPYSASALGVLPPLWSRAAKKPRPVRTFSDWVVFTLPYSRTRPTGLAPRGDGADERGGDGRPPGRQTAGRQRRTAPWRGAAACSSGAEVHRSVPAGDGGDNQPG